MNRATNILIQLGEALGPQGAFVVLLLLCAGAVWVVMAIRSNQADHARVEKKIDTGLERVEGKVDTGLERVEGKVDTGHVRLEGKIESSRKEAREESKEARDESKETRAQIQALRDETRAESREARAELRAINSRLDQLLGRKPPDQTS